MARETTSFFQPLFLAEGIDPEITRVRRFSTREAISAPYGIDLDLEVKEGSIDAPGLVRRPVQILVVDPATDSVERRITGEVTRVRERAVAKNKQQLTITVEAPIVALRAYRDRRIFQNQTTQKIVETLLSEIGIDPSKVFFRLAGSYPEREVCTQLDETSLDFVHRILEEDGIFYFYEHHEDGPALVFGDSASAYAATEPAQEIRFMPETGLISHQAVTHIALVARLRPAKVTLRDHDFQRPSLDLTADASGDAPLGVEHYDYPGRYTDPDLGKRRAQARLDALTAEATGAVGRGTAASFAPGHTFKLTDAPDSALDGEWVVVGLEQSFDETRGAASRLSNEFRLLRKDAAFRPPARTARAIMPGPQLAVVTGPSGEEIHCDSFGRVKVQYVWDRRGESDDKSSCWVRVGQMHLGGAIAIPRVGWEVMVDFEDGDPDRPIIVGRLYNGQNGPPQPLPAKKTMTSLKSLSSPGGSGYNEIHMDDAASAERFQVYAQKDQNLNVGNNKTEKVTNTSSHAVGSNHSREVGSNETVQVGATSSLTVGANQTWSVGGSRTKSVTGEEEITITGDRSLSIGGSHTTMTPMSVDTSTPASFSETIGGSCIEAAALGVGMVAVGSASFTVGGAKIEAVATGKTDFTLGAQASTIGGALISATGKNVAFNVGGAKATTVGGAWMANSGSDVQISSGASLNINVGGAVLMNAAKIVLKVGGSSVTIASGGVVLTSSDIKLTATGPQPEISVMVGDKP